ncbi:hypothetical protein [Caudoviricetes sp.]|nr:hypothetical protein [Caudoviricetes sp.]
MATYELSKDGQVLGVLKRKGDVVKVADDVEPASNWLPLDEPARQAVILKASQDAEKITKTSQSVEVNTKAFKKEIDQLTEKLRVANRDKDKALASLAKAEAQITVLESLVPKAVEEVGVTDLTQQTKADKTT